MATFPLTVTDTELIAFIDRWTALLEIEAYADALALVNPLSEQGWTPELVRRVIEDYGGAGARVTRTGVAIGTTPRRQVDRWLQNAAGSTAGSGMI